MKHCKKATVGNDACIDALADVLQLSTGVIDLSICHTGFWAAIRDYGWGQEAEKLIHPDPEETTMWNWQALRLTRGHLESKLLMIPCNFQGRGKVEVGHWVLAIREKGKDGKHKLHVLDSLGQDSGRKHRNTIASKLFRSPLFPNFPKGKTFDAVKQFECECGARMAKYMEDISRNYANMDSRDNIANMIGKTISREKNQGRREVGKCRIQIKDRLEGERRNLLSNN